MAQIKSFAALRPKSELAEKICELPYDVLSTEEARAQSQGNPLSFFHVSKPEIDFPKSVDPCSAKVYAKGKENFARLLGEGALELDDQPRYYFYRQIMGGHAQVGLVAVASCQDYLDGIIKKHELTHPDKEDDRVRHIEALNAQTGPVFLTYKSNPAMDKLVYNKTAGTPVIDFTSPDGVRHSSWGIRGRPSIEFIEKFFTESPALYIADGHHRCAAAARVFQKRRGAGESGFFLCVLFPHSQMQILPYNRVLKDLNGLTPAKLLAKLEKIFKISDTQNPKPAVKHQMCLYMEGQWRNLEFLPKFVKSKDPIKNLDVSLLQEKVLAPVFGIDDPRTSKKIHFVGGIRGTAELEKLVNSKEYACAFSMFPTSIEDLMAVADKDGIMPPKSTWFEPKLRDAMFCHMI